MRSPAQDGHSATRPGTAHHGLKSVYRVPPEVLRVPEVHQSRPQPHHFGARSKKAKENADNKTNLAAASEKKRKKQEISSWNNKQQKICWDNPTTVKAHITEHYQ